MYSLYLLLREDMCQLVSTVNNLDLQLTYELGATVIEHKYLSASALCALAERNV